MLLKVLYWRPAKLYFRDLYYQLLIIIITIIAIIIIIIITIIIAIVVVIAVYCCYFVNVAITIVIILLSHAQSILLHLKRNALPTGSYIHSQDCCYVCIFK